MKVAALILAHKNAQQIAHLIRAIHTPEIDVFVHLWKISKSEMEIISREGGEIVPRRVSTYLDEWSLVEATFILLKYALNKNSYCYFFLLSGQDYPIKPIAAFTNYLNFYYPKPFIDCTPYDCDNWVFHKFRKTPVHQLILKLTNRISGFFHVRVPKAKEIRTFIDSLVPRRYAIYNKLLNRTDVYGGSAWWVLPDLVIKEIINDMNNNAPIVDLFKKSQTPEETFFQSFTMRSSLSKLVDVNPKEQVSQNCLTFANFTNPYKQFVGHPHIITVDDWWWLKERKEFFARKFDECVDNKIIGIINKEILVEQS